MQTVTSFGENTPTAINTSEILILYLIKT